MPVIVCDSSSLISFSETCLVDAMRFMHRECGARFLVPPGVRAEIVSRPMHIPRYELSAIRLNKLLQDGVLDVINTPNLKQATARLLSLANSMFYVKGKPLSILQEGEAECVAVFSGMSAGGLLIDEKTTRLLLEAPATLYERISGEYGNGVKLNEHALDDWRNATGEIFVLRSSELLAIAAEKGFFSDYNSLSREALQAALYVLRDAGCSLSSEELAEYARLRV